MYIYQKNSSLPAYFSKVLESIYPGLWNITIIEWAKVKMLFAGKINLNWILIGHSDTSACASKLIKT